MSSIILIGKGYSVKKCSKSFVDSHDYVCIINSPVYNGYTDLISDRADFMFTNKTGMVYGDNLINELGLKKMFFTGHPYQRFQRTSSIVESVYPNPNLHEEIKKKEGFSASSGLQALTYMINTNKYNKISLVGFDFYVLGQPPYYYGKDEAHNEIKYLWEGAWKNNVVNIPSGHDTDKSINYLEKLIKENKQIEFNIISNNDRVNKINSENVIIID
jgi:hypothetical protein